jgi:hypothetical protein
MISGDRKNIDAMELFIAKIKLGKYGFVAW